MSAGLLLLGLSWICRRPGVGGLLSRFARWQVTLPLYPFTVSIMALIWSSLEGYHARMDGFGWNESPYVYQTVSGVRSQFLRSRRVPTFTYKDDSWQCSPFVFRSSTPRKQWMAAAAGLRLAVALSFCAAFFLSISIYDLIPTRKLRYIGQLCDSGRALFRVTNCAGSTTLSDKYLSMGRLRYLR